MKSKETMKTGGTFHLKCYKDASLKELLWEEDAKNGCTYQGLDQLNNEFFYTTAKLAHAWYLELSTAGAFSATAVYATPGYTASTAYAARPACVFAASSSRVVTNAASVAVFTNTGTTETIHGVALVGATSGNYTTPGNTDATGGVQFSYGVLTADQPWVSGNVINLTYSVTSATA